MLTSMKAYMAVLNVPLGTVRQKVLWLITCLWEILGSIPYRQGGYYHASKIKSSNGKNTEKDNYKHSTEKQVTHIGSSSLVNTGCK
jgi:hypothetical protein